MCGQGSFLFSGPLLVPDAVIEVVVVPFAALFSVAAADVELAFHDPGDLRPPLHLLVLVEVLEDAVLLRQRKSTTSLQALRSLIPAI